MGYEQRLQRNGSIKTLYTSRCAIPSTCEAAVKQNFATSDSRHNQCKRSSTLSRRYEQSNCPMQPVWVIPTSSRLQPNRSRASLRQHLPPIQLQEEHGLPDNHLVNCSLTELTRTPFHNAFLILIYINAANIEIKLNSLLCISTFRSSSKT